MDNKITLESILKTEKELRERKYGIKNNIIESVDVNTVAHFGNVTCLEILCKNVCPMSSYNNTYNLGLIIRALIKLLGISREDGLRLSEINNIPCRLVFEDENAWGSRAVGIGHWMEDKFVLISDLNTIDKW